MRRPAFALALALALGFAPAAHALSTPAVAVMPFKDLSGGKGSVGEAIRETVTTDLKDVPGLKVIERSFIDKVLAEQHLQANKADLDPTSTVKVGKLLGASLIVAGAYQRAASNVRLTARFVKVETGEIVGTAKVDGAASDFLKLQDRVTAELLKSAGIEQKHVQRFAKRTRPKLKSLKTVELYGDAVVESDDTKRRDILKLALNEDPHFVYASRDLDALEARLKQYDALNKAETDKELKAYFDVIKTEKDPTKLQMAYTQIFSKLATQRRWIAVHRVARQVLANPPPSTPYFDLTAFAQHNVISSLQMMKDWDGVLREGEKFLQKYPTSPYFGGVRSTMDQAIEKKRAMQEGAQKVQAELAGLSPDERRDTCVVAQKYLGQQQFKDARRLFETCLQQGGSRRLPGGIAYMLLMQACIETADFGAARRYLEKLRAVDPELAKTAQAFEWQMPSDG